MQDRLVRLNTALVAWNQVCLGRRGLLCVILTERRSSPVGNDAGCITMFMTVRCMLGTGDVIVVIGHNLPLNRSN